MKLTEQKLNNINLILVDYLKTFRLLEVEVIPCFDGINNIYDGILNVLNRRNLLTQKTFNILNDYYNKNYDELNNIFKEDTENNPDREDLPNPLDTSNYSQLKANAIGMNPVATVSSKGNC